jgi:raffinose/stachyose/melibiose transport system substrate-binding protein
VFRRISTIGCAVAAVAAVATGAALAARATGKADQVTLTLWHNYGTEGNAVATTNLVAAFEKQNPGIKINVVSQPAANYFQLLTAAWIAGTGPDLSVQWTGLYDLKYEQQLLNLKPYFSASELAKINGAQWASSNFNTRQGLLVMPLENQFYMGFYNKTLFKKAGISQAPRNWAELQTACTKLKTIGVTPIVYGADPQGIGPSPYPFYDISYLMAGLYSPSQWRGLYDGKIPWTSPGIVKQVTQWASMPKNGCTNSNVLTQTDILGYFESGKAAMIIDGNWDAGTLYKAMGSSVAAMLPPFTSKPQKGVIQYAGDGFAVSKSSKHQAEAVKFLKFLLTPKAAAIIKAAGLIPDTKGATAQNPLDNEMLRFAKGGDVAYPMIDNVIQGDVVTAGQNQLDAALGGNTSAGDALQKMQSTWSSLPADQRSSTYK